MKKYKIKLNIIKINKKLYIFKLFNFYERNKWNEFEQIYKSNILNLNIFLFNIVSLLFFLIIFFQIFWESCWSMLIIFFIFVF